MATPNLTASLALDVPGPISLPPPPLPQVAEGRWIKRLDLVLAGAVLLFAFLLASFPVRNSDFWQHLAAGRLLARGEYTFGVDPFAFTTEETYWANHAWLFDLSVNLLYQVIGGAGLVVVKALLITALAWLMLRIRCPGGATWVPPACTALALLTLSPRLLLQPTCLSFVLLGLTLFLLWRGHYRDTSPERQRWDVPSLALRACVPLTCALWVNLDAWFFLGPLLVALFWVGGLLTSRRNLSEPAPRVPGWLVLASLGACLCNPHHLRAFVLPVELSLDPWVIGLRQDLRFRSLFASPWEGRGMVSLAAWAYFLLLALGLLSFALPRKERPAWRLVVWLAFGLLGAWQARLVPFFAIVAGPITTLNLHGALLRQFPFPGKGWLAVTGRLAFLSACLALIVLAWPGVLQGLPRAERHVGWGIEPNPSLLRSAETLLSWRRAGRLAPDERVLALHPDVTYYWAWFCPQEKGFLDHRFSLFGSVASAFVEVSRALYPDLVAPNGKDPTSPKRQRGDWRQVLRFHGIRYIVLFDPDRGRLASALQRLARDSTEWELCSVDGQALLVRWNDPEKAKPAGEGRLDADRLAFGAEEEAAPGRDPDHAPVSRTWWSAFWQPVRPTAWEAVTAAVYLRLFEERAPFESRQMRARLCRSAASLVGLEALPALHVPAQFLSPSDRSSPALLLLAIRAGRRALAVNAEDAGTWVVLGRTYLTLGAVTGEGDQGGPHAPLPRLRHVQAVTALYHALTLQPNLETAHAALADLYARRQYLDAALPHRQAQLRLTRRGPLEGEDPQAFAVRLAELERAAEELEKAVQDRQQQFTVQTSLPGTGTNPRARALLAIRLGLPEKALEILGRSRVEEFGGDGARLELELLLMLGRAREARDKLYDDQMQANQRKLGYLDSPVLDPAGRVHVYRLPAYDLLCLWEAAAQGDYDRAGNLLAGIGERLRAEEVRFDLPQLRSGLALAIASEVLARCPPPALLLWLGGLWERQRLANQYSHVQGAALLPSERADLEVVAGLLALERGLPEQAATHLRRALDLSPNFVGRPVAREYLRWLEAGGS